MSSWHVCCDLRFGVTSKLHLNSWMSWAVFWWNHGISPGFFREDVGCCQQFQSSKVASENDLSRWAWFKWFVRFPIKLWGCFEVFLVPFPFCHVGGVLSWSCTLSFLQWISSPTYSTVPRCYRGSQNPAIQGLSSKMIRSMRFSLVSL